MNGCVYFVEGECEKKLLTALKEQPSVVLPGRVKVRNVVSGLIPKSELLALKPNTDVVLVFDTDVPNTNILKINLDNIKKYTRSVRILTVLQVPDFEAEIVRSTDAKQVKEITQSKSNTDFKRDFCRLSDCRSTLIKHHFDISKMWKQKPTGAYGFLEQRGKDVVCYPMKMRPSPLKCYNKPAVPNTLHGCFLFERRVYDRDRSFQSA